MNELVNLNFDAFADGVGDLTTHQAIISLPRLADRYKLATRDDLVQDHPDLWERGFLPVVRRDAFDASIEDAAIDELHDPLSWTNYIAVGTDWYVLVPNFKVPGPVWGVLAFDIGLGIARPVFFNAINYLGTFWPFNRCITSRGECRNVSCNQPNHSCKKLRGDSASRGGRYFWCECG